MYLGRYVYVYVYMPRYRLWCMLTGSRYVLRSSLEVYIYWMRQFYICACCDNFTCGRRLEAG